MPNAASLKHVHSINPDRENRAENDFYKTPPIGTQRLLNVENLVGPVWEPACGDGAISKVLIERGYDVISSDLYYKGYGEIRCFLHDEPPDGYVSIVTNPPYKLAEEFAHRGLELIKPKGKLILLCRLLWLEGKRRRSFFETSPFSRVWVSSSRLNVSRNGTDYGDNGEGGMVAFAWFVWEYGYTGEPKLGWI